MTFIRAEGDHQFMISNSSSAYPYIAADPTARRRRSAVSETERRAAARTLALLLLLQLLLLLLQLLLLLRLLLLLLVLLQWPLLAPRDAEAPHAHVPTRAALKMRTAAALAAAARGLAIGTEAVEIPISTTDTI